MGTRSTYSHRGGNCTKTTRYSDGCARSTTSDRKSGKVLSETKHKTSRHQNW